MNTFSSVNSPQLDQCDRQDIFTYFDQAWQFEDHLWQSLISDDAYYTNPDPLRNLLIFYLGHSAVFYVNKLIRVGLLTERINPDYEVIFEIGVDPEKPDEIADKFATLRNINVDSVWEYRRTVHSAIADLIHRTEINLPINQMSKRSLCSR